MRAPLLALSVGLAGCATTWLPTTQFHVPLAHAGAPVEADWLGLGAAGPSGAADVVAAVEATGDHEWIVWTATQNGRGTLARVRQTALGLEAQSVGDHVGPFVRGTLRSLPVSGGAIVVVESSITASSTDRDAWLYFDDGAHIVPCSLAGGLARLHVRAERSAPLERGWARASILTATFEAANGGVVVHEHASVREIPVDRPELSARSTYEVERARTLTHHAGRLSADRVSLFDDEE